MKIGVPRETAEWGGASHSSPMWSSGIVAKELDVVVEAGAGAAASYTDDAYAEAGAEIGDPWGPRSSSRLRPRPATSSRLKRGQVLIGFLQPLTNSELARSLAAAGVVSFAVESVPRITRAQSMDALAPRPTSAATCPS